MKSKITISKKMFAFLIFCLFSISVSLAQTFPPANTSCTSGDLTLVGATLSGGDVCNSCPTATQITRTLTLSINNTTGSVRTSFAYWGNLEIYSGTTGQLISSTVISGCNGPLPPNTITTLSYNTVTYTCGDILKISNIFLAWTSASPGSVCPLDPNDISPKCGKLPEITINGGVNGDFVVVDSQCGSATGSLNLTPMFGTAPYTYSWSATGGGVVPAGQQNQQDLTGLVPGTYSVVITDVNGCSITKTRVVGSTTAPVAAFANTSDITVPCGAATTSSLSYTNGASGSCLISGSVMSTLGTLIPANPSSPACGGTIVETWTYTDFLGRTITKTRNITVSPAALPTLTAPANITVACGSLPAPSTLTFTNGLSGGCLITGTSNPSTFSTLPGACGGTVTETWTATDSCGRTIAPVSRTITINPAALPTMTAPANITVACGSIPAPSTISFSNGLTGGCLISGTSNPSTFSATPSACGGTVTETWTATDSCGRALASVSRTITVSPAALPTMTAPANITVACGSIPAPSTISFSNGLSGGCLISGTSNLSTFTATPSSCGGTVTETWTATDSCGRALASVSRTITVSPAALPTMTAPANITVACGSIPAPSTISFTNGLSGGCLISGTSNLSTFTATPSSCGGTVTETWTATDSCGRALASVSRTITVSPAALPTMTAPANITVSCVGQIPSASTLPFSNGLTGGCAISGTSNQSTFTTVVAGNCNGQVTQTWTATDSCGRALAPVSRTIIINDTTAPVIAALPGASTISCPATPSFAQATATDNCGTVASLTFNDVRTDGACAGTYSVTRTWTATDICGNASTATQTINVTDTTAPVIAALPATSTINCPATPVFAQATATDACGSGATLSFVDNTTPGNCAGNYSVTRTWTAVDACGNSSTASQTINVQDVTAPTFTVPADVTINAGANCASNLDPTATGTVTNISDACDPNPTVSYTDINCYGNDNDASINAGGGNYFYFTVSGQDNLTAKDIEKLALAFETNQGKGRAEFTLVAPSGQAVVLVGPYCTGGACEDANASDQELYLPVFYPNASGYPHWNNNNVIPQDIEQNFTPNGALSSPNTITGVTSYVSSFENLTGPMNGTWFVYSRKQANVNGSIEFKSVCLTPAPVCASNRAITRTWTVTDQCGNTATATQTIRIQDITAPVIATLPAASTINCPATPVFAQATATDNCDTDVALTFVDVTTNGACAGSYSVTRTWTATDDCGNTATASQTINVQDVDAPVIAQLPAASTINCPATPVFAQATATDACGSTFTLTSNDVTTPGACAGSYSVTRTWTATDACGNSSTASQTINVQDVDAPVIAQLPATSTINCPATPIFAQATATDNCDTDVALTFVDATTNGACAGSYSVTRTWTATDACGNTATASQTINVQDVDAPVIAQLPAASTINCPATPVFAQATATDACGSAFELTFEDVTTNGACAGSYTVTRTWTATDACGNTATASQTINVQDVDAPVIAQLPATSTINCPATPEFAQATATDACGSAFELTFEDVTTNGACAGSYSITRTWTATDACGNTATASQTINVQDVDAPVIAELPASSTINCPATPEFAQATATDNCGSAFELTFEDVTTNGACAGSYSVTRTWTATDACGNIATASQTINVQDVDAPVIAELPTTSTINCPATPEFAQATATDVCGSAFELTFEDVTTSTNCAGNYSVTRTWTATDACGNASTASQTINVQDITAPVITTQASNILVECDGNGNELALFTWLTNNGGATATDECSAVTWSNNFSEIANDCSAAVTVVFTATDECGNATSTSATFTINDTQDPVAPEAPASVTVACASDIPAMISLTATDNCSAPITVEGVDATTEGPCSGTFTITRTWTFTDACNNTSSVSQTINVVDDVAPTVPEAPADVTVACAADVPAMISLTATDNCGDQITVEGVDATTEGPCSGTFTVTRTWTFTDACGNTSAVSQTINVVDDVAPTAPEAPADVTVACAADVPAMISLTATDNCGAQITAQGVDATTPGNCVNSFTVIRTWTFTDACNNTSSVSQTINVVDDVAPVAPEAPANVTVACAADVPAMISLTATDNCTGEITVDGVDAITEGPCSGTFTVTRTWTFTDACNNTSSVSQTINVVDDVAPTAPQAPADVTVACAGDVPAMISLTATDNCGAQITVEGVDATTQGNCVNSFTVIRTWTFTDACNNTSSVSQTINVVDDVAPVAPEAPADITVACAGDVPAMISLTATDNCTGEITVDGVDAITEGPCSGTFTITRTWTFTDACNNTSSVSQTINVVDDVAPTAPEAPADVTVACAADVPAMISLTAIDNCGDQITVEGVDATTEGPCSGTFTVTRTWTFTDACNNTSSVSQTINVVDDVAPTAPEAPADVTVACAADVPAMISLTATDNCGDFITAEGLDVTTPGQCSGTFTVTRTWTFTDACNNTSSVSQTINVVDNIPPTAPQAPADVTVACAGDIPAMISLSATDNCSDVITVQGVDSTTPGNCANSFTVTRTWTFTDACNNTSSVSQTINVNDNVAPTFDVAAPADTTASCDNIPAPAVLTASDNCGVATVNMTENIIQGNCPSNYQIVRTWTATDACGNNVSVVQNIGVSDTTGPVAGDTPLQVKIEATCDNIPEPPVLVFTDNCSAVGTPVFTQTQTPADEGGVYTIIRTWVVSDACGNLSQTYTQLVFVTQVPEVTEIQAESCNEAEFDTIDLNSLLPEGTTGGVWANVDNVGGLNGTIFNAWQIPVGVYTFSYTINDGPCPRRYDIKMTVNDECGPLACDEVIIHNAFTPNGDAFNQFFNIENIEQECRPSNKVEIYNRWGILVYETKNYDNNTRRFEGISEGRATVSKSEELPTGTYFYIIEWTNSDGSKVTKDGYLYLTR